MLTIEYTSPDGYVCVDLSANTITTYEDGSKTVAVQATRAVTDDELAFAMSQAATPEVEAPVNRLAAALEVLRAANADGQITSQEMAAAFSVVKPALEHYRDIGQFDADASFQTILLLSQVCQALFAVAGQMSYGMGLQSQLLAQHSARLTTLEAG